CGGDPCEAARKARAAGAYIRLDVIGFDVKGDEAQQLQCIAKNGGGKYYSADNAGELAKSFSQIKESIAGNTPLIHHYEFDADASDSVGNADGTLLNGASVRDGSLILDGKDDYVQIGSHIIPAKGSYTLTFFARQSAVQKTYTEFVSQGRSRGPGFYIGQAPSGAIRVTDFSSDGTRAKMATDGKWHHYALVVNSTAGKTQLFIDNVPQVAFNSSLFSTASGTHTRFGRQFEPYKEFFFGQLDDIRIYDGVLTIGEISSIAKNIKRDE
ncbi:MAG: LamG-like jellyroll fold domain-containing protein, partial [Mariprofundus sp.]